MGKLGLAANPGLRGAKSGKSKHFFVFSFFSKIVVTMFDQLRERALQYKSLVKLSQTKTYYVL